jgi:pimeloyl-ACP methyl ester carboxylesterase
MRGEFIDVGGTRIYYYAAGTRGVGEPVVLIHGLLTSSHLWNRVVPLMPSGHRVVVPDLVGCGRSDPPTLTGQTADVSARGHAVRMVRLLDGLGVDKACLAAHGTGASIALAVLADHPDRVTRLCLVGAVTSASRPRATPLSAIPDRWLGGLPLPLALALVRHAMSRGYLHPALFAHSVEHYLRPFSVPTGRMALVAQLHALRTGSALTAIPERHTLPPTTVVWGAHDPVVRPSVGRRLSGRLAGSRFVLVEGGHFSPEESPEHVAAALAALLASS